MALQATLACHGVLTSDYFQSIDIVLTRAHFKSQTNVQKLKKNNKLSHQTRICDSKCQKRLSLQKVMLQINRYYTKASCFWRVFILIKYQTRKERFVLAPESLECQSLAILLTWAQKGTVGNERKPSHCFPIPSIVQAGFSGDSSYCRGLSLCRPAQPVMPHHPIEERNSQPVQVCHH